MVAEVLLGCSLGTRKKNLRAKGPEEEEEEGNAIDEVQRQKECWCMEAEGGGAGWERGGMAMLPGWLWALLLVKLRTLESAV